MFNRINKGKNISIRKDSNDTGNSLYATINVNGSQSNRTANGMMNLINVRPNGGIIIRRSRNYEMSKTSNNKNKKKVLLDKNLGNSKKSKFLKKPAISKHFSSCANIKSNMIWKLENNYLRRCFSLNSMVNIILNNQSSAKKKTCTKANQEVMKKEVIILSAKGILRNEYKSNRSSQFAKENPLLSSLVLSKIEDKLFSKEFEPIKIEKENYNLIETRHIFEYEISDYAYEGNRCFHNTLYNCFNVSSTIKRQRYSKHKSNSFLSMFYKNMVISLIQYYLVNKTKCHSIISEMRVKCIKEELKNCFNPMEEFFKFKTKAVPQHHNINELERMTKGIDFYNHQNKQYEFEKFKGTPKKTGSVIFKYNNVKYSYNEIVKIKIEPVLPHRNKRRNSNTHLIVPIKKCIKNILTLQLLIN